MKKRLSIVLVLTLLITSLVIARETVSAAELGGVWDGKTYYLINCASEKALQVDGGVDANNRNVNQAEKSDSSRQKFKLVYNVIKDAYKFYAMCSSSGSNRVLDVERNTSNNIVANCNVQIWTPDDHDTQFFQFQSYGSGYYYIALQSNPNLVLTVYDTSNGTSSGRTSTSAGNVFVTTKRTTSNGFSNNDIYKQLWRLEYIETGRSLQDGVYEIKADFSNKVLTALANDNVVQAYPVQTQSQYFAVEYVSDGYYHITTRRGDGKRVTVNTIGSGNKNIEMAAPLPAGSDDTQLFRIIPCGNNQYRIVGKWGHENYRCLDVEEGNTANNANVIYYRYLGNPCQKWSFELMVPLVISPEQYYGSLGWGYVFENENIMRKITVDYHPLPDGVGHRGIDIISIRGDNDTPGQTIISPTNGTVLYVNRVYDADSREPQQGYCVAIKTNNVSPETGERIIVTFMHLQDPPTLVKDALISKGDFIGYVGETGNATNDHLHLETHSSGKWYSADNINHIYYPTIDPKLFFPNIEFS